MAEADQERYNKEIKVSELKRFEQMNFIDGFYFKGSKTNTVVQYLPFTWSQKIASTILSHLIDHDLLLINDIA